MNVLSFICLFWGKKSSTQQTLSKNGFFFLPVLSDWTVSKHYTCFIQTLQLGCSTLAQLHPAQISYSIGLSLTGSLDLLREALSLLILDLTLGRTTNNSFPRGAQLSIIHTDLPWLQFSFIFRQAEEEKPNRVLLTHRIVQLFPRQCSTSLLLLLKWIPRNCWFYFSKHKC